jgi:hypothetical protein
MTLHAGVFIADAKLALKFQPQELGSQSARASCNLEYELTENGIKKLAAGYRVTL